MNRNTFRTLAARCLQLGLSGAMLASPVAQAAQFWLQTGATTVAGAAGVPMWGYALCGTGATAPAGWPATCAGTVTVPGPALQVPPGEGLTVHLSNTLPEPTSIVINGQPRGKTDTALTPVWFEPDTPATVYAGSRPAGNTTARVRSFDVEAAPQGTAIYSWSSIRPGTYLYASGTHPQVQVQMGLYGAMTKDAGVSKVAYSQGATNISYNAQLTLLYSEIDPALHAAVSGGTYGPKRTVTSTLAYNPKYFLINGVAYPDPALAPMAAIAAGQSLLIRFLNAGLKTHVPTINGQYWKVVAEDGNPVPFAANARQQYSVFLPAGKTSDVLLQPANASTTATLQAAIFDSRFFDMNNGAPGTGLLAKLDILPGTGAAPVFDSTPVLTATLNTPYAYAAHAIDPDGQGVAYSLQVKPAGMTVDTGSGVVAWPAASVVSGTYPVTVRATDPTQLFADQTYSLVVSAATANRKPVAANDTATAVAHDKSFGNQGAAAPGVLANDSDPDGNAITAIKESECTLPPNSSNCTTSSRVTLAGTGAYTVTSNGNTGTIRLKYHAQDSGGLISNSATLTIAINANRAPVAVADAVHVPICSDPSSTKGGVNSTCQTSTYPAQALALVGNDTDPDTQTIDAANQVPLTVARIRSQVSGSTQGSQAGSAFYTSKNGLVALSAAGVVTYTPPYRLSGTDTFQYRVKDRLGKESGSTTGNQTGNYSNGWATVTVTVP